MSFSNLFTGSVSSKQGGPISVWEELIPRTYLKKKKKNRF